MPQQPVASIQNKFTKGLVTEYSGLSFPEDAATDCDNTTFTIVGDVTRREGIDKEVNGSFASLGAAGQAMSSYVWKNVGGDGNTQIVVEQVGATLYFYRNSTSTIAAPLSTQLLPSTVNIASFIALGSTANVALSECQYADGNGYLFVFHHSCDPFYCTYVNGVITGASIPLQIRDFSGINEPGLKYNARPATQSQEHLYNLVNQGWTAGNPWTALSFSNVTMHTGLLTFNNVQAGLPISIGDTCTFNAEQAAGSIVVIYGNGIVNSYSGTTLVINCTATTQTGLQNFNSTWYITQLNKGYISTWNSAIGNFPSNADVWWYFKDDTGVFNPTTTITNVSLSIGPAPQGSFILNAFSQTRSATSGVSGLTDVITMERPRTGCWFAGRVWYTGVDSSQQATGDAQYYTWTENIYFSQIVTDKTDFGLCYQTNDPTSENLFDLLPTDGGIINLQGSGSIYKLFSYQNGLLVFTANGIKFITGSQGIGFTANDYTVTDISSVHCISANSFVNVNGIPYFWNEDGIYTVQPSKNGGLTVEPITVSTILQFYDKIPLSSKKHARGAYHPIDYTIQWLYKDTESTSTTDKYKFNKILNFNTYNQAFFPYSVDISNAAINSIAYVSGPGGLNTPDPAFKYFCSNGTNYTYADEHDETYTDWVSFTPIDFSSYFITGYEIRGQAQKMFFPGYVWMFSKSGNDFDTAYTFNSIWDYANSGNSGRWSSERHVDIPPMNYDLCYRRHKVRGHGLALQFKVQSVSGKNFDIIGWTSSDNVNTGI